MDRNNISSSHTQPNHDTFDSKQSADQLAASSQRASEEFAAEESSLADECIMEEDLEGLASDEQLVDSFFAQHAFTVADEGFTERVMQQICPTYQAETSSASQPLSVYSRRIGQLWTAICVVAAIAITVALDGLGQLRQLLTTFVGNFTESLLSADLSLSTPLLALTAMAIVGFMMGLEKIEMMKR